LIQTLTKNWWLLALCGVLDAIISVIYLITFSHSQSGEPCGMVSRTSGFLARLGRRRQVLLWRFSLWRITGFNSNAGLFTIQCFFGSAFTLGSAQSVCWRWHSACTNWVRPNPKLSKLADQLVF
jgi:hypothetical protein